jgi:hypothetical protein
MWQYYLLLKAKGDKSCGSWWRMGERFCEQFAFLFLYLFLVSYVWRHGNGDLVFRWHLAFGLCLVILDVWRYGWVWVVELWLCWFLEDVHYEVWNFTIYVCTNVDWQIKLMILSLTFCVCVCVLSWSWR